MDFNEIFRKNVTCDNIKSHKKSSLHPLFRRHNIRKSTGGGVKLAPSLLSIKVKYKAFFIIFEGLQLTKIVLDL